MLHILASRWTLSLLGTALLAAVAWVFAPLLPELEPVAARIAVVTAMLLVWTLANMLLDQRRRARDQALTHGAGGGEATEEAAALRRRLTEALTTLRKSRGRRGYLYQQPWYMIIGPPGAGKTTALLNAGLTFPLADTMGRAPVAGVGGTRMCDWWFTDDAVLIDTAGRYTTQDSDATVDRAGWEAFLAMLRRTRPRQPLNGVIVAIALSDVAAGTPAERTAHAKAIAARLAELEARLGLRLPVYALFTKSDLIAGFTEFFDDLDRDGRAQVWGVTFPKTADAAGFAEDFKALLDRLDRRMFDRLQAEPSPERRALIAGFPAQVASLSQPVTQFLQAAFDGGQAGKVPWLRGAYFTSGTQEGTPIDRLVATLGRSFGIDQRRATALRPEQGRSYFLGHLLTRVVFGEAMLASDNPRARRRRATLRAVGYGVALLTALGVGGVLLAQRAAGLGQVESVAAALAGYEHTASAASLDPVADADLAAVAPLLAQAERLQGGAGEMTTDTLSLGLSQTARLQSSAQAVYRHALERVLLPRLLWRLESQMRGSLNRPDFLYEATRVYLMLGGDGPLDPGLVQEWMGLDWGIAYPGPDNAALRTDLSRHLKALLADPLPAVALDGALVTEARATFGRVPLAQRIYSRIKPSAAAQRLAPWQPNEALGGLGVRLFVRASGQPLTAGIPGFFTLPGFHQVLLPGIPAAARSVAAESWVMGGKTNFDPTGPGLRDIQHDVIALYEADYIAAWDGMLADLNVAPLRSITQAAQSLLILSSPQSPMRGLLASAARQVTLSVPSGQSVQAAPGSRMQAVFVQEPAGAAGPPPGIEVDMRFKMLRDLVGDGGGGAAPIDAPLQAVYDVQQLLAKIAAQPLGSAAPVVANDPAVPLRAEAGRQPQPLQRWLLAIANASAALRSGSGRQQVVAAYNAPNGPGPTCTLATRGRYPFDRSSGTDVSVEDFTRIFAPGGLLDGFLNTQLRPSVDMSGKVWKPQAQDGVPAPVTADDVAQFQRAAAIRDLFFPAGSAAPTLRLDVAPVFLDIGARSAVLALDGVEIVATRGAPRAASIVWPSPAPGGGRTELDFDPAPGTGAAPFTGEGAWAMFRLFDRGQWLAGAGPEKSVLAYRQANRSASFEIRAGSAASPLSPALLSGFHCPSVQ